MKLEKAINWEKALSWFIGVGIFAWIWNEGWVEFAIRIFFFGSFVAIAVVAAWIGFFAGKQEGKDWRMKKLLDRVRESRDVTVQARVLKLQSEHRKYRSLAHDTIDNEEHRDVVIAALDEKLAEEVARLLGLPGGP